VKKTGLFFGSFNPVHIGHLILANHIVQLKKLDELWFVVSPLNPLKEVRSLAAEIDRINMVQVAIEGSSRLFVSDVEFHLSKPSYTVNTLRHLKDKEPDREFYVILGEDIKLNFHLWKDYLWILENVPMILYPRHITQEIPTIIPWSDYSVEVISAPRIEISSTMIRENISRGYDIRFMVPDQVIKYIQANQLYR
jgi:nicotinate-nucleotide adenylyltransferase